MLPAHWKDKEGFAHLKLALADLDVWVLGPELQVVLGAALRHVVLGMKGLVLAAATDNIMLAWCSLGSISPKLHDHLDVFV